MRMFCKEGRCDLGVARIPPTEVRGLQDDRCRIPFRLILLCHFKFGAVLSPFVAAHVV